MNKFVLGSLLVSSLISLTAAAEMSVTQNNGYTVYSGDGDVRVVRKDSRTQAWDNGKLVEDKSTTLRDGKLVTTDHLKNPSTTAPATAATADSDDDDREEVAPPPNISPRRNSAAEQEARRAEREARRAKWDADFEARFGRRMPSMDDDAEFDAPTSVTTARSSSSSSVNCKEGLCKIKTCDNGVCKESTCEGTVYIMNNVHRCAPRARSSSASPTPTVRSPRQSLGVLPVDQGASQ